MVQKLIYLLLLTFGDGTDIKKPKIDISGIWWNIHRLKIVWEIGLPGVDIQDLK